MSVAAPLVAAPLARQPAPLVAGLLLLAVLLPTLALALAAGAYATPPALLWRALQGEAPEVLAVVLELRLPRALLALATGAVLAAGGAALQAVFRNPLAEPGVLGISAGAAVGAALTAVLGWAAWLAPGAFIGALLALAVVQLVARRATAVDGATLLLAGIAVNAVAVAVLGLLQYLADPGVLRTFTLWMLGSLALPGRGLLPVLACAVLAVLALWWLAPRLDVLALGRREAGHLGHHPERLVLAVALAMAVGVGAVTALAGLLPFVGLLVPHLVRAAGFVGHRALIPLSALAGATLLLAADLACRLLLAPEELPVGVLTTLLGGPFFLWLLWRRGGGQP